MKRLILFILIFITIGCTSYPFKISEVELDSQAKLSLLEGKNFRPVSALQKLTIDWQGHTVSFNVQLEVSENSITIVGLTPVFSRSFIISYENQVLDFQEHPFFRYPVKPENMLADFQIAFADVTALKIIKGYVNQTNNQRKIFTDNNDEIISISYSDNEIWKSEITLKHLTRNYSITIKTLEFEFL